MNYFELFEIPVSLKVEPSVLTRKYFELSRKYHPDYFARASAQEQEEALERSAQLNKALQTFRSAEETIKYVLLLKGLLVEEEKYPLPPDFLMEVMDLNEQLMELELEPDPDVLEAAETNTRRLNKKIYDEVASVIEQYEEGVTAAEALLQVKEYYYQKKYLDRILEKLEALKKGIS